MVVYMEISIHTDQSITEGGFVLPDMPVTPQNYQRKSFRKATFCISAVLFAGVMMLSFNFLISAYVYATLPSLFGESFPASEWQEELVDIVLNLSLLLLPGVFLLIIFRKNPISPFAGPLSTPRYPFLFVPMCIGALYALNFAVNMVFGDLFAPFDPVIDPSFYPTTLPGMLLYFTQVVIIPAIFEEWLFRGIMLRQLIPSVGKWPAVVISAFVFGLMHLSPATSIFAFGFGLFAGYAYISTGSIWFGALIHMLNNAISCSVTYWSDVFAREDVANAFGVFSLLMMVFGVISLSFYVRRARRGDVHTRRTAEERLLPEGGEVFRATLRNPVLYLLIIVYGLLLWLFYLAY